MSADLLRRAAQFLRTRAEAAAPGPWLVVDPNEGSGLLPFWQVVNDAFLNPPADEDAPWVAIDLHTGTQDDAYYVEAMHPPVALALAELLVEVADHIDAAAPLAEQLGVEPHEVLNLSGPAIAVARAILREAPDA